MAWPTTSDPKTEFATLRFTASEAHELDTAAAAVGQNRSQFIRDCVARCIAADKRRAAKRRAAGQKGGTDD